MKSLAVATAVAYLAPFVVAQSSIPDGNTAITLTSALPSASSDAVQTGCPTVTATRELCTTCPVPACLALSTVTQSCGCPTPVPTVQLDFPCASGCSGLWCSTSYAIITASGCPNGGSSATLESTLTTSAPNGTLSRPLPTGTPTGPSVSTSSRPVVSVNAAGRARVPFSLW